MTLTPELETAGRKLVVNYHKGAELKDVEPLAGVVDEPERQDFLFLMLEMTVAATEVLHGRSSRQLSVDGFMRHGYSREKAETYFDLAFNTLEGHTKKSASSDGALAARNNPLLASKVASLANRQARSLNRLSGTNRILSVLVPVGLFLFFVVVFKLTWWLALVVAVVTAAMLLTIGHILAGIVTSRFAKEFLATWPPRGADHALAVAILDCLDGVPLKDELVGKVKKSEIDRINKALKSRRLAG